MRYSSIICLLSLSLAFTSLTYAEPVEPKEQDETTVEISSAEAKEDNNKNKKKPQKEKAERFVMPFTKWVEGKLHNSPVINPTKDAIEKRAKTSHRDLMRTAIRRALKAYPGTVLSVDKSIQNQTQIYKVKIISKSGVVKIVTIQMDVPEPAKEK